MENRPFVRLERAGRFKEMQPRQTARPSRRARNSVSRHVEPGLLDQIKSSARSFLQDILGGGHEARDDWSANRTSEPAVEEPKEETREDEPLDRSLQSFERSILPFVGILGYELDSLPSLYFPDSFPGVESGAVEVEKILEKWSRTVGSLRGERVAYSIRVRSEADTQRLRLALLARVSLPSDDDLSSEIDEACRRLTNLLSTAGVAHTALTEASLPFFLDPFGESGYLLEIRQAHNLVELTDVGSDGVGRTDNYVVYPFERASGDWLELFSSLSRLEKDALISLHLEPTKARTLPDEQSYFSRAADYAQRLEQIQFSGRRNFIKENSTAAPKVARLYQEMQETLGQPCLVVAQVVANKSSVVRTLAETLQAAFQDSRGAGETAQYGFKSRSQVLKPVSAEDFLASRCTLTQLLLTDWLEGNAPRPLPACQRLRFLSSPQSAATLFRLPICRGAGIPGLPRPSSLEEQIREVEVRYGELQSVGSDKLKETIKNHYPHHMAICYSRMASQGDLRQQWPFVTLLLEVTLQHVGLVLLVDFLNQKPRLSKEEKNLAYGAIAGVITERPTNGKWRALIRELGQALSQEKDSFTYALAQAVTRKGVDELFSKIIEQRNETAHGLYNDDVAESLRDNLLKLLASLPILAVWKLVRVDGITLEGENLVFDARILHGENEYFDRVKGYSDPPVKPNEVVLLNLGRKTSLSLHPWLQVEACDTCSDHHLFHYVFRKNLLEMRLRSFRTRARLEADSENSSVLDHELIHTPGFEIDSKKLRNNSSYNQSVRQDYKKLTAPGLQFVAHSFEPGDILVGNDTYTISDFIARGGTAEVYRATRKSDSAEVALKLLPFRRLPTVATRHRFEEEQRMAIEIANQGGHPNIVNVYECGFHSDAIYIAMDVATGWETTKGKVFHLGDLPRSVDVDQLVDIALQICSALEFVHEKGIIHRDIKPANILLFGPDKVCLTDFGIALTPLDLNLTTSGTPFVGTPQYLSPEHFDGRENICPASDLYCLGLVLYELGAGHRPMPDDDPMAILDWHRDKTATPASFTLGDDRKSKRLEALILELLEKDLSQRPSTAASVKERLSEIAG